MSIPVAQSLVDPPTIERHYSLIWAVHAALNAILYLIRRQRERTALGDLSDRLLADIGVSPDEARRVAAQPFWRR